MLLWIDGAWVGLPLMAEQEDLYIRKQGITDGGRVGKVRIVMT